MKRKLSLLLTLLMVITMIPFNASHAVSTNYVDRVVSVKDTADLSTDSNMPSLVIKNSGKTFQSNENFDLELGAKAEWLDAIEGRSYFVGAEGQNLGLATGVGGTNAQGTVVFKDGAVASDLIAALAAKGQSATLVGTDARLVNGGKITVRVAGEGFNRVYTTVVEGTNVPAPTVPTIEQIFANGYIQVSDGTRVTFQLNADKTGGKLIQGTATKAQMDEAVAIFDQAMKNAGYGGGGFGGGSATANDTFNLEKVYTKADGTTFTLTKVYSKNPGSSINPINIVDAINKDGKLTVTINGVEKTLNVKASIEKVGVQRVWIITALEPQTREDQIAIFHDYMVPTALAYNEARNNAPVYILDKVVFEGTFTQNNRGFYHEQLLKSDDISNVWIVKDPVPAERDILKIPVAMQACDMAKFNNHPDTAKSTITDKNEYINGKTKAEMYFAPATLPDGSDVRIYANKANLKEDKVIGSGKYITGNEIAVMTDGKNNNNGELITEEYTIHTDASKNVKIAKNAVAGVTAGITYTENSPIRDIVNKLVEQGESNQYGGHIFERTLAETLSGGNPKGYEVYVTGHEGNSNEKLLVEWVKTTTGSTAVVRKEKGVAPEDNEPGLNGFYYMASNREDTDIIITDPNNEDQVVLRGKLERLKEAGSGDSSVAVTHRNALRGEAGVLVILKSACDETEIKWEDQGTNSNTVADVAAEKTGIASVASKTGVIKQGEKVEGLTADGKTISYTVKLIVAKANEIGFATQADYAKYLKEDQTTGSMEAEISERFVGENGVIIIRSNNDLGFVTYVENVKDMIQAEKPTNGFNGYYGNNDFSQVKGKEIELFDNEATRYDLNVEETDEVKSGSQVVVTKNDQEYRYDVREVEVYRRNFDKDPYKTVTGAEIRLAPKNKAKRAVGGGAFGGGAEMIVSERIDVNGTTGTTTTPANSVGTVTFQKMSKYIVRVTLNANAALSDKFQIEVPMMVKLKGADTGAQKVAIVSRDSAITAGEYTYANVGSSEIAVRVKEVQKIARGDNRSNNVTLIFDELINSAFRQGDQIKLRLPNGFTWNLNTKSNNAGYTAAVNPDNSRELIVTLGAANHSIKETIYVDAVIDASRDARLGNIDVTVTNGKVSPQNLVIAEYVAYNVDLKVDKVLEVIAGRDIPGEYRSRIKISEPVAKAIAASRYIEVSFVDKDGKAVDASLQHGENVEIIGNSFLYIPSQDYLKTSDRGAHVVAVDTGYKKGTDGDMVGTFDLQTAGTLVETAQNYELYLPFVVSTDYTGELFVKFHGAGIDGQVKIADVIAPVSYKVEANTQVKIGLQKQKATDIVVTETKAGALQDFTAETAKYAEYKIVPSKEWFKFVSGSAVVEEGDIIISKSNGDFKRGIKVERKSTKPSTIRFKDMEVTLDRTVPYGGLDLKLNFGQVGMRHDLTNTMATVKDYFFTETPVALDQRVSTIFKIGEPGYTTITGTTAQEHEANVAPFIENGRTMLPVRQVADAVGAITNWDAATKTATFQKDNNTVTIQIDKAQMQVNGNNIPLYAKPANVNDRILLPIANIAQAFGLEHGTEIIWDQDTQTVIILPQNPTATEKEQAFKVAGVKEKKVEAPATSSTEETKAPVTVTP